MTVVCCGESELSPQVQSPARCQTGRKGQGCRKLVRTVGKCWTCEGGGGQLPGRVDTGPLSLALGGRHLTFKEWCTAEVRPAW